MPDLTGLKRRCVAGQAGVLVLLLAMLIAAYSPAADTLSVEPGNHPTIQAAIDAAFLDAFGNAATFDDRLIALSLDSNPGNAALGGTTSAHSSGGVAAWSAPQNLNITVADAGYTMRASAGAVRIGLSVADAVSRTITIDAGTPSKLAFGVQPTNTTPGDAIFPPVAVVVLDSFGNFVPNAANANAIAIANNPGTGTLSGGGPVPASGGVATFPGVSISAAGDGYLHGASSGVLTPALSIPFRVIETGAPPEPQPQPRPDLSFIMNGDAQDSLITLLFRNGVCGLGAAA